MFKRIGQVEIVTDQLERTVQFYVDASGSCEPVPTYSDAYRGISSRLSEVTSASNQVV